MRYSLLISTAILLASASAFAQEAPYSHTLDAQMNRAQDGQLANLSPSSGTDTTHQTMKNGPIDSTGSGAIPSLPLAVQENNGVRYLTGGVGDEEMAELKSMQHQFNVQLLLSANSGDYMSEVQLQVMDASGKEVFSAPSVGPYVYLQMKPDNYTAVLTSKTGETKKVKLSVGKGVAKPQVRFNG